jgi:hypothetical protein
LRKKLASYCHFVKLPRAMRNPLLSIFALCANVVAQEAFEPPDFNITVALIANGINVSSLRAINTLTDRSLPNSCALVVSHTVSTRFSRSLSDITSVPRSPQSSATILSRLYPLPPTGPFSNPPYIRAVPSLHTPRSTYPPLSYSRASSRALSLSRAVVTLLSLVRRASRAALRLIWWVLMSGSSRKMERRWRLGRVIGGWMCMSIWSRTGLRLWVEG